MTVVLSLLSTAPTLFAQKKESNSIPYSSVQSEENYGRFRYIELKGHTGYHLYAGELLNDAVSDGFGSVEFRFGWQPNDKEHWSGQYGYASYGLGYYSGFIGDPQVLGKPNAVFGFITFPLTHPSKRNRFEMGPSLGLTYNLEPYDPDTNPENDAIGSPFAVYFNLYFGGAYKATRELDLLYGIDYTHFSNGRMTTPNYGLNMYGLNIGLRYHYNADQRFVNNDPYTNELLPARFKGYPKVPNTKISENSLEIYTAIGTVQNEEDKGTSKRYTTFSGVLDYRYKFNNMHGVTAGFDIFYDESLKVDYPETKDQFLYGLHGGYDFMFWRAMVRLQVGAYLGDDKGKLPTYMRAAFRYDFNHWLFAQIGVKTKNTSRADWVEWGIGFRPFKF